MFTARFCKTLTHISHQRVFTDADIRTPGMVTSIEKAVEKAYKEMKDADIILNPYFELVLELIDGEEWGYYFADHVSRVIFWFEAHKSSYLIGNVRGVKCSDHISEFFPRSISHPIFFHYAAPRIYTRITVLVRTASEVCTFLTGPK
jgi:hypothetical protein